MTKQVVRIGAAAMITLLALLILWQFRMVLVNVLISLALAAAIRPLIKRLEARSILSRVMWLGMYVVSIISIALLIFKASEKAVIEIQELVNALSVQNEWMLPVWLNGSLFQKELIARLPPPNLLFEAITGNQGQFVLPTIFSFAVGVGGVINNSLIVLFLSIYWSINQIHFERLWLSLLAPDVRKTARGIWRTIELDIGAYIRGELLLSLTAGMLLGLGYWLLGSPYPAFLALIGAVACLIPVFWIILAVFPVMLVGLLTSVQLSIFTAVFAFAVLLALAIWIKPRLFLKQWQSPILTIILLIALADALGFVGIIVAPPLSAVCQILWNRLVGQQEVAGASSTIAELKDRQIKVGEIIAVMDEPPLELVGGSIDRLTALIDEADRILKTRKLPAEPLAQNVNINFGLDEPIISKDESSESKS